MFEVAICNDAWLRRTGNPGNAQLTGADISYLNDDISEVNMNPNQSNFRDGVSTIQHPRFYTSNYNTAKRHLFARDGLHLYPKGAQQLEFPPLVTSTAQPPTPTQPPVATQPTIPTTPPSVPIRPTPTITEPPLATNQPAVPTQRTASTTASQSTSTSAQFRSVTTTLNRPLFSTHYISSRRW